MTTKRGTISGINGNLMTVEFEDAVIQNEVAYAVLGDTRLKAEVIRVRGRQADLQVFEDTTGLQVGGKVEFTGKLLSVELAPGLLGQIFDGLQNPLPKLAEQCGFFLKRGMYLPAIPRDRTWAYTPTVSPGDTVRAGDTLGTVPEGIFYASDHGALYALRVVARRVRRTGGELHRGAGNYPPSSRLSERSRLWRTRRRAGPPAQRAGNAERQHAPDLAG